jgi:uncharacterized protein (UPF0548 family)
MGRRSLADKPFGLLQRQLNYDVVGATSVTAAAFRSPIGFRVHESSVHIGEGLARWELASTAVLRWGVKTRSGFTVLADGQVSGDPPPVILDERYWLVAHAGPFRIREPVQVVSVLDEPNRRGFAYGTLEGHPVSGEESFVVERRADGSVWLTLRSVSRSPSGIWRLAHPGVAIAQRWYRRRYLRALGGPQVDR